jgi:hypothetical protein
MKHIVALMLIMLGGSAAAHAQAVIPDLRGTWTGKDKSVVFGANPHHPGSQTVASPPRVRDFEFTIVVDGQEGRLAWGHSFSTAAATNEPFAWAISTDGKSITGADTDGYFHASMLSADRMEMCYAHAGISPSKSIVATCFIAERTKK